jgi:hypothetical protein
MPIQHSLWRVDVTNPQPLREAKLVSEAQLEEMIIAAPEFISSQWMIIGRQVDTRQGGRIDLLAIAPDSGLVLIELKKDRTPRDVVAQAVDYASWVERLDAQAIARIYGDFRKGRSLDADFKTRFSLTLDLDAEERAHQIVVVSARLDPASERIVKYLNDRGVGINVLCFQVFEHDGGQFLSRAWLIDPGEAQAVAASSGGGAAKEPWNGEWYASFGHSNERDWSEAVRFGFISAGGGPWYTGTLRLLPPDGLVWVKAPGKGFVGVGRVRGEATPARDFLIRDADGIERPALEVLKNGEYYRKVADDMEKCEYFVPMEWSETRSVDKGVTDTGLFGNQNTVCAPKTQKWGFTVERLKERFPNWASVS